LKPGERKVISDGTEGPVVEIIRKAKTDVKTVIEDSRYDEDAGTALEDHDDRSEEEIAGE